MQTDFSKRCFVIMPFGKDETEEAKWTARYSELIERAVLKSNLGLEATRVDAINRPGGIPEEIFKNLEYSRYVIADLSAENQNVAYELGIRHARKHGTILIAEKGTKLPFDFGKERIIFFSDDVEGRQRAVDRIVNSLGEMASDPKHEDSPFFRTLVNKLHGVSEATNSHESNNPTLAPYVLDDETVFRDRLDRVLTTKRFKPHWSMNVLEWFNAFEGGGQHSATLFLFFRRFWVDGKESELNFVADFVRGLEQYVEVLRKEPTDEFASTFCGTRDLTIVVPTVYSISQQQRILRLLKKYINECLPLDLQQLLSSGLYEHLRLMRDANVVVWDSTKLEHFERTALEARQLSFRTHITSHH